MITEFYILWGVIAVFGWLFILDWEEGIDAHKEPEQDDKEQLKAFKEQLIQREKDDI